MLARENGQMATENVYGLLFGHKSMAATPPFIRCSPYDVTAPTHEPRNYHSK